MSIGCDVYECTGSHWADGYCRKHVAPQPDLGAVHRGWTLTGLGRAVLAADERLCASDLFTPEQYDAIRNAGMDVFFVRADSLLGLS